MARRKYVKENNLVKAINTDSLELQKPLVNEYYDINVHNSNMDKIDLGYKQNKNDISNINYELSKTENTKYSTENGVKEFECKNGYVDNVVIEGKTLVNLVDFSTLNSPDKNCRTYKLKANATYTLFNFLDSQSLILNEDLSRLIDWTDNKVYTFINPKDQVVIPHSDSIGFKMVILEGDHTDKPISYFEGLKSVGQGDKIEVLSRKEDGNLWDGTYEIGSIDVTNGVDNSNGTNRKRSFYIPVLPNTNYNVKVCDLINTANDGINIHIYDIDKKPLKWNTINTYNYYITNANEKLITTPSNCRYIKFRTEDNRVLNSNSVIISSNTISGNEKPQLDKKQILTTLRSLPNGVKDTIEKRGNKYYKIKRCDENSTYLLNYFGETSSGSGIYQGEIKSNLKYKDNIVSNLFPSKGNVAETTIFIHPSSRDTIVFRFKGTAITTKEQAENYLKDNNFRCVVELETPIIEELPNFNPQTFSDKTTLLLNSGVVQAEASFEVTNSLGSEIEVLKGKSTDIEEGIINNLYGYQKHKLTMDNGRTSTYQGDFNSLIETGFYYTHTFSNGPVPTGTGVYVEVIKHQGSYILQRVTIPSSAGDIAIWSRIMYNGSWKSWTKLIDKVVGATSISLEEQVLSLEEQVLSLEENNINMQDKISILTEENEKLKQELALTQDAVNEILFMTMNMEGK